MFSGVFLKLPVHLSVCPSVYKILVSVKALVGVLSHPQCDSSNSSSLLQTWTNCYLVEEQRQVTVKTYILTPFF